MKKNKLFALMYSTENVDYAATHRFARVTPDYILIYTNKTRLKPPTGKAAEIKKDDLNALTRLDEAWLFDCGITLLAERAMTNKAEGLKRLSEMVYRLETELEGVTEHESA